MQYRCLELALEDEDLLELAQLDTLNKAAVSAKHAKNTTIKAKAEAKRSLKEVVEARVELATVIQKARDELSGLRKALKLWGEQHQLRNEVAKLKKGEGCVQASCFRV